MTFKERIQPILVALAHELLDRGLFADSEALANVLKALSSGRWEQLPTEEQLFWVKRLRDRLAGRDSLIDVLGYEHVLLGEGISILAVQEKALTRGVDGRA